MDNLSVGTREDLSKVCDFEEADPLFLTNIAESNCKVQLIAGDILNEHLAHEVVRGVDVIVHLAANTGVGPSVENPRLDCVTNVIGTLNYLEAARLNKVPRFVFASSGAPIGAVAPPIHEELAPHPVSPYGASKLAGEGYCSAYYRTFGIDTVSLRFGNVYGPLCSHKNSVVAKFIRQAFQGELLEIYGDGTQTRDFIFIDDLVRAIRLAAAKENIGGEIFQIGSNAETSLLELDMLLPILKEAGAKDIKVINTAPRLGDMARNFSDTAKAKRLLGWQSEVDLPQGLKQTVEWFCGSKMPKH